MATIDAVSIKVKTGDEITIRVAGAEDAGPLLSFVREAAATTDQIASQPDEFPATEEVEREYVEQALSHAARLLLLAIHGGDIIGCLHFGAQQRSRLSHTGDLGMLVHDKWRGRGVGAAVVQVLLDWAREHPTIEKVCLSVF